MTAVEDVAEARRADSQTVVNLLEQVVKLAQLLLAVSASEASGERFFNAHRRV